MRFFHGAARSHAHIVYSGTCIFASRSWATVAVGLRQEQVPFCRLEFDMLEGVVLLKFVGKLFGGTCFILAPVESREFSFEREGMA